MSSDRITERVVLRSEGHRWVGPVGWGIEPHRLADELGRLPRVPRPNMGVKEVVSIPEDLKIDPKERAIGLQTGTLDGPAKHCHALEEGNPVATGKVRKAIGRGIVAEEQAIARKPLDIADDGEAAGHPA